MNEEHFLKFDEYLQGEMKAGDKLVFEQQLKDEPELAAAFKKYKDHFKKTKSKGIAVKTWYYAVAALVVVLFVFFFLNQETNPVFENYDHPETIFFTERGETSDDLRMAQEAYNAKKYKEAIMFFEIILKTNQSAEIQYYYGRSLFEVNRIADAERVFGALKSGNSTYKNKAIWSLALSKLKQKDYKACKELLLTIPEDYEGNDQVDALLAELN